MPNIKLSASGMAQLCDALPLEQLEELTFGAARLDSGAALKELMSHELPALRILEFGGETFDNAALSALLDRSPAALESLSLRGCLLADDGFETLLSSPLGAQLKRLDLAGAGRAGGAAALALSVAGPLPNLEELELSSSELGARGAMLLSRATLPGLRSLKLNRCGLDAAGVEALLETPWMAGVERLELNNSELDATSMRRLMERAHHLRNLRRLDLSWCKLGPGGVMALARCADLERLEELELESNNMGISALQALLRAPWIGRLRVLRLRYNNLDDAAARAIAECAALWGLEQLSVDDDNKLMTRAGEQALDASPHLNTLAWTRRHEEEPLRRQRGITPRAAVKPPMVRKRTK